MTLNDSMAVILRYFTELGSFRGALRKSGWRRRRKKVHVRYLISWWVSCTNWVANTWNSLPKSVCLLILTRSEQDYINSGTIRILYIISEHICKEPEVVQSFRTKNL